MVPKETVCIPQKLVAEVAVHTRLLTNPAQRIPVVRLKPVEAAELQVSVEPVVKWVLPPVPLKRMDSALLIHQTHVHQTAEHNHAPPQEQAVLLDRAAVDLALQLAQQEPAGEEEHRVFAVLASLEVQAEGYVHQKRANSLE